MRIALVFALVVTLVSNSFAADPPPPAETVVRIATYNVSMYRDRAGQLREELETGESRQAKQIAEVLQRVRPDVVLLNEFDYESKENPQKPRPPAALRELYLEQPQTSLEPIHYPHAFYEPVNTGVDSGMDLDNDGKLGGPADALGFGRYPGQYGMLVLSRFPIGAESWTYRDLRWKELPSPLWPKAAESGEQFYSDDERTIFRLPSKSFWDVAIRLPRDLRTEGLKTLRVLCSHPTPPVFDGPEDANGRRNYDEIRMIAHYLKNRDKPVYSEDSGEGLTGLDADDPFIVLGDLNADPNDGDSRPGAIEQLLDHPAIDASFVPTSQGGVANAKRRGARKRKGDPSHHTSKFGLRVDYALPSKGLKVVGGGVYWPTAGEPGAEAVEASDHRLVWIDVRL